MLDKVRFQQSLLGKRKVVIQNAKLFQTFFRLF